MDGILESISDAIHDFFVDICDELFIGIFNDTNAAVGRIGKEVALTPSSWNPGIYNMIKNLSTNVIIPIAGLIITFVVCYELITAITEKNNMHDVDTFIFFKFIFKAAIAVMLLSHTFEITMGIFDVGQWVVQKASESITNDTYVNVPKIYKSLRGMLSHMGTGSLIALIIEASVVSLTVKAISILVLVILTNRMIEIYLYSSIAPIPFATMTNREWGNIGTNYIRSIASLAFQGFFIMVIVGIYSSLIKEMISYSDLHTLLMKITAYSVILGFSLFRTSSLSRSIFNAH